MKYKNLKLTIITCEERNASSYYSNPNSFGRNYGNAHTRTSYTYKCLLINGILDNGTEVYFFTPKCEIAETTGSLNYKKLNSTNGWFKEVDHGYEGIKNDFYYNDNKGNRSIGEVPVAVFHKVEIVPAVKIGDTIKVDFNSTYTAPNGKMKLTHVKLK